MDSFENLMAILLEREGYWVTTSFKVDLSKSEKVKIGKPTTPRWELDLVAYKAGLNKLLIVECKSFLNSIGVTYEFFLGTNEKVPNRYKLFNDSSLFRVVKNRLVKQLTASGACLEKPTVNLCLAAGKIQNEHNKALIKALFIKKGWVLFDNTWIKEKLKEYAQSGYENEMAAVVTKLIT